MIWLRPSDDLEYDSKTHELSSALTRGYGRRHG
jgi:hypothetical protein